MTFDTTLRAHARSCSGVGSSLNDTWEWDGTEWTEVVPPVSSRTDGSGTISPTTPPREVVVLHGGGGFADTWEYLAESSSVSVFCCGSAACPGGEIVYEVTASNDEIGDLRLVVHVSGEGVPGDGQVIHQELVPALGGVTPTCGLDPPASFPSTCPTTITVTASLETADGSMVVAEDRRSVGIVELD